jgi:hypothetical protein
MEFTSLGELYKKLIPAFNVKKRLILNSKYKEITNENIWNYLTDTKWRQAVDLSLTDMINDIITADLADIYKYMEE